LGRTIQIAPSILAADFANLASEIQKVEAAGADLLHFDVMDGHFVPNISIGLPVLESLRKVTKLPIDAHLMISEPSRFIQDMARAGANWISVHVEADLHLNRTLNWLRESGVVPGVALNPSTPIGAIEEVLPLVDYVLLMTVNPGFGGQEFIPASISRIRRLRQLIDSGGHSVRIEIDGGIGIGNLAQVLTAGAEIVVAGSSVFRAAEGAGSALSKMKQVAQRHERVLETA
jgi:ribulose-phosphate 3-epimerase